jgi:hypothetical protein
MQTSFALMKKSLNNKARERSVQARIENDVELIINSIKPEEIGRMYGPVAAPVDLFDEEAASRGDADRKDQQIIFFPHQSDAAGLRQMPLERIGFNVKMVAMQA